jgi:HEAT repeat protein
MSRQFCLVAIFCLPSVLAALGCGRPSPRQESLQELTQELHDASPSIRSHAVIKLGHYGEEAVPALISGLKDKDHAIRSCVALTLAGMGEPAVPALVEVLQDRDREAQKAALFALSMGDMRGKHKAVPRLLKLARNRDTALAADALNLLQQIDPASAGSIQMEPAQPPAAAR